MFFLFRPDPDAELYPNPRGAVKLDTVVTMIDSVTDEMNFYKEKVFILSKSPILNL